MRISGVLTEQDLGDGFEFDEADDHLAYLLRHGERVAVFSASGMDSKSLRQVIEEDKQREAVAERP